MVDTDNFDATWAVFKRIARDEGYNAAYKWLRVHWLLEASKQEIKADDK